MGWEGMGGNGRQWFHWIVALYLLLVFHSPKFKNLPGRYSQKILFVYSWAIPFDTCAESSADAGKRVSMGSNC